VTGDQEKLEEFISLITGYGAVEITRSGIVSMSLDNKKLRLSPPVPRGAAAEEALQLQETE
jgi:Small subunit of acetolactate synthase